MDEFFDLETRKKIYRLIEKNPGLNLSAIAEMLQMNVPLVDYHTRYFEKQELITVVKEGGYKRYYVKGAVGVAEKRFFELLRQEIPLKIVLFLLKNPHSSHGEIHQVFEISKSTLSYHLAKLVKHNIIGVRVHGDEKTYVVVNEQKMVRFLVRYRPSRVLKRFKETWLDFSIP
jgi:predicted transcriptional regulator